MQKGAVRRMHRARFVRISTSVKRTTLHVAPNARRAVTVRTDTIVLPGPAWRRRMPGMRAARRRSVRADTAPTVSVATTAAPASVWRATFPAQRGRALPSRRVRIRIQSVPETGLTATVTSGATVPADAPIIPAIPVTDLLETATAAMRTRAAVSSLHQPSVSIRPIPVCWTAPAPAAVPTAPPRKTPRTELSVTPTPTVPARGASVPW